MVVVTIKKRHIPKVIVRHTAVRIRCQKEKNTNNQNSIYNSCNLLTKIKCHKVCTFEMCRIGFLQRSRLCAVGELTNRPPGTEA